MPDESEPSNRAQPWAARIPAPLLHAAVAVVIGTLLLSCLLLSDNLESLSESTAYDRLVLGQRTFLPGQEHGPWPRWDTNFPLGTAAVFALPQLLGCDPVAFGRLHSLLWALLALVAIGALTRRSLPSMPVVLPVLALAGIPAFVRGAVVSSEASPAAALLLIAVLGLGAGTSAATGEKALRRRWLVLSLVAVNAMVLFRLDLMLVVPALAGLGLWRIGRLPGLAYATACGTTSAVHLLLAASLHGGSPLQIAQSARTTTAHSAGGFGAVPAASDMLHSVASQLAGPWLGWPLLALALLGALVALRPAGEARGRVLAILWLWTLAAYQGACLTGVLEGRSARYLVPLLALSCPLVLQGAASSRDSFRAPPPDKDTGPGDGHRVRDRSADSGRRGARHQVARGPGGVRLVARRAGRRRAPSHRRTTRDGHHPQRPALQPDRRAARASPRADAERGAGRGDAGATSALAAGLSRASRVGVGRRSRTRPSSASTLRRVAGAGVECRWCRCGPLGGRERGRVSSERGRFSRSIFEVEVENEVENEVQVEVEVAPGIRLDLHFMAAFAAASLLLIQ